MPRSPAISRCLRPLVCKRRTASSLKTRSNRRPLFPFCFDIRTSCDQISIAGRLHFLQQGPPPQEAVVEPEPATAEAITFVEKALASPDEPVVLFALEWCEFSWSVRKMFAEYNIPYRSIDLDSVEYQKDNWGGNIRNALRQRISIPTIPQIFVGGEHIGGATETFDAFNEDRLQALLSKHDITIPDHNQDNDAYAFMPTWLHPR